MFIFAISFYISQKEVGTLSRYITLTPKFSLISATHAVRHKNMGANLCCLGEQVYEI